MFFLEHFDMLSGGALGALFVGLVACAAWEKGWPRAGSAGPSDTHAPDIERVVAKAWNWAMEPLLFGTMGSSIMFARLTAASIPKSVAIVAAGVALRVLCTFLVMFDRQYTWRERLFYAVAWTPKATVQASLSAVPLTMVTARYAGAPDFDRWQQWGEQILTTGVFAIIICGTLGTLCVHLLAPRLLVRDEAAALPRARSEARMGGAGGGGGGSIARPSLGKPPSGGRPSGGGRPSLEAPHLALTRAATGSSAAFSGCVFYVCVLCVSRGKGS